MSTNVTAFEKPEFPKVTTPWAAFEPVGCNFRLIEGEAHFAPAYADGSSPTEEEFEPVMWEVAEERYSEEELSGIVSLLRGLAATAQGTIQFNCSRCGKRGTQDDGTPCEGCGEGMCFDCVPSDPTCPKCGSCVLCGAELGRGEEHDMGLHA